MAINFPVSLDDLANVSTGNTITPAHKNDLNDIVEALEAKVGINNSAVVTSHDYLLTHLPAQVQNLDIGAYDLRGQTLTADVTTGTIPLVITSTTKCTNLNADYVDGKHVAGTDGAGEITTNDGTQTLTNKTLTSPTISGGAITGITDITVADGGTGRSTSTTAYGVICAGTTATGALQTTASAGTANQYLVSGGISALPAWSTATIPTTATGTGTILRADGTNWVATTATYPTTTTVSQILYSSSANVIGGITTTNSGVLITSAGGVPSIATDIPTAVTIGSAYVYRVGGTDVALTDGGTGAGTQAGAANAVLPSQTGNANKCLATDASNVSWQVLGTAGGGTGATANANAASGVVVLTAGGLIASSMMTGLVNTTALKTATGEVSTTSFAFLTLPGGEYGFYPQIKSAAGAGDGIGASIGTLPGSNAGPVNTTYATIITMGGMSNAGVVYAQQRYVTASGLDHWIFLLFNKKLNKIEQAYQAPDHPCYGNGGDFKELPHPFVSYKKEPDLELMLVGYEFTQYIKSQVTRKNSLLTLINEQYLPNMRKTDTYKPIHTGLFIDEKPVMIKEIPEYIKVRELVRIKSPREKEDGDCY